MRSIANSRILWATVIEKVLKIRNAPTKTAIPAKTSSAVEKAEALLDVAGVLLRRLLAGAHLDLVGGQRGGDRRRQLGGGGSSAAVASISSTRPLAGQPLRLRKRELHQAGATGQGAGSELADSGHRVVALPAAPVTRIVSPTSALALGRDAVDRDLAIGGRVSAVDDREGLERRVLGKPADRDVRWAALRRADPVAVLVDDRDRVVADRADGEVDPLDRPHVLDQRLGQRPREQVPNSPSTATLGRTVTSIPSLTSAKMSSKELFTDAVSIEVSRRSSRRRRRPPRPSRAPALAGAEGHGSRARTPAAA